MCVCGLSQALLACASDATALRVTGAHSYLEYRKVAGPWTPMHSPARGTSGLRGQPQSSAALCSSPTHSRPPHVASRRRPSHRVLVDAVQHATSLAEASRLRQDEGSPLLVAQLEVLLVEAGRHGRRRHHR